MHEPARVVEILVQNPQNTPYSEVQNTPQNENCQRVQIREFQNTPPPMKIVRESKSKSFRIPPNGNCQSPNLRVSEYPPPQNENCQRVQIQEFQNTPPPNENCQRVQI